MVYIVIGLNMEWQKQHINLENVKEQYIDGEKFYQYTAIDEY